MTATDLLVWGIVLHLVADWLLQNEWMALNKVRPGHIAGPVHASIHAALLAIIFPFEVALLLGLAHLLVDYRFPLAWWRRMIRQTTEGPMTPHVAIWGDQVLHIACIAVAALVIGS